MSESHEVVKQKLHDTRRENARLHDEKMHLLKTVAELQNELSRLRERLKGSDVEAGKGQ